MRIKTKPRIVLTFVIAAFLTLTACSMGKSKQVAEQAVVKFHNQLNAGQYHDIYVQTDEGFQKATSEADAMALFEAVHRKLGNVKQATPTSWRVNATPMGTLTVLTYNVDFEEGKGTEEFVFRVSGDKALLFNYNVNSPLLITK